MRALRSRGRRRGINLRGQRDRRRRIPFPGHGRGLFDLFPVKTRNGVDVVGRRFRVRRLRGHDRARGGDHRIRPPQLMLILMLLRRLRLVSMRPYGLEGVVARLLVMVEVVMIV